MAWTRFGKKKDMPGGLWIKCESCGTMLFRKEFESKHRVCGSCGYHFTLPARERIELTADPGTFKELHAKLEAEDRLHFVDRVPYAKKLKASQKKTGEKDALVMGTCEVKGLPVVMAVMNFTFMGGSMGAVVGEKIALAVELGIKKKLPVIIVCCSGGARMHEGPISLMQMAKTCGAIARLNEVGGFSISVMTHPTTGGVTASFASVCDVLLAEPGALIGFAGPRVIATTIKRELPKGFQRSEFLLERGQIDRIVTRDKMRDELARLIAYYNGGDPIAAYGPWEPAESAAQPSAQPSAQPAAQPARMQPTAQTAGASKPKKEKKSKPSQKAKKPKAKSKGS